MRVLNIFIKCMACSVLLLFIQPVFAAVPHCIGINNQSNQSIVYSQFPDDFGDVYVKPHQKQIPCEAASLIEYITLADVTTGKTLVSTPMARCSTITYFGGKHKPMWQINTGCN